MGRARKCLGVAMEPVMGTRIAVLVLEIVGGHVHYPHVLKGKVWTEMATVSRRHLIVPPRFLEGSGVERIVSVPMG